MKKVLITARPTSASGLASADDWVDNVQSIAEPTKRLTIDVSLSLHQRVKSQCALRGINMADVLRELLEKAFPEEYQQTGAGGDSLTT